MNEDDASLVLDLDETLVNSCSNAVNEAQMIAVRERVVKLKDVNKAFYEIKWDEPKGPQYMWGVIRPYALEFLEFVRYRMKTVTIFSAGSDDYVKKLIAKMKNVLNMDDDLFNAVLGRTHCTQCQGIYYKDMRKITGNQVMLIDDREDVTDLPQLTKQLKQIVIPAFKRVHASDRSLQDRSDDALAKLTLWMYTNRLKRLLDHPNIDFKKPLIKFMSEAVQSAVLFDQNIAEIPGVRGVIEANIEMYREITEFRSVVNF